MILWIHLHLLYQCVIWPMFLYLTGMVFGFFIGLLSRSLFRDITLLVSEAIGKIKNRSLSNEL